MSSVTRTTAANVAPTIAPNSHSRPRSARRNWWSVMPGFLLSRRLEEAFAHVDHVVGLDRVGELGVDALGAVPVLAADLHAALGAARGDAARDRDRLHDGHVGLEPVRPTLLHLAVHVDHRRAVHVDRVARRELDVLAQVAVAEHRREVDIGLLAVARGDDGDEVRARGGYAAR